MSTSPNPPAGWYPDPAGQGSRYWDGMRWTQHVQPTSAAAPAPAPPTAPQAPAAAPSPVPPPPPPSYAPHAGAPAAPAPSAATPGANAFLQGLQRLEAFPLTIVAAALFLVSTFFPWADTNLGPSVNAWEGDAAWAFLGISAEEVAQGAGSGQTDLLLLIPLAAAAVVLIVLLRQGKTISYGHEIAIGCAGLLTLALVWEAIHLNGVVDDVRGFGFGNLTGGPAFGLFLAIFAAGGMTFASIRGYLTSKRG